MTPYQLHHQELLKWFKQDARDLPWRLSYLHQNSHFEVTSSKTQLRDFEKQYQAPQLPIRDPYYTWISEIMLQQTQVATVIDYFNNWIKVFPSVDALAQAPEEEVLKAWTGLGYYSRARNIHKSAQIIVQQYQSHLPQTRAELLSLPGIGEYTAGAILSLALGQQEAILDGNCIRVLSRLKEIPLFPTKKSELNLYWEEARQWAQTPEVNLVNEAIMELGAKICKPQNPLCEECPLQKLCPTSQTQDWALYPPPKPRPVVHQHKLYAYVFSTPSQILMGHNQNYSFLAKNPSFYFDTQDRCLELNQLGFNSQLLTGPLIKHTITRNKLEIQIISVAIEDSMQGLVNKISEEMNWPIQEFQWKAYSELPGITTLNQKIWQQWLVSLPALHPDTDSRI